VALELGQAEGFDQLSMRSLARVLGVTPMALYHHVNDKQDLNALLVDTILSRVEVPGIEFGDWKSKMMLGAIAERSRTGLSRSLR
jgi:AcrR family transcriptional regulator